MIFGVKNDRATVVTQCEPWAFQPQVPLFGKKEEYLRWRGAEGTDHLLFFGSEGVNAQVRPNSKTNPIQRLHCLVVDYDSVITPAMEEGGLACAPADLRPNWISTTFSGGRRLVYLFEKPIPFSDVVAKSFFRMAGDVLRIRKLLPAPDEKAFGNPYQIYDCGTAWTQLSDKPLSINLLNLWLYEASKRADWKSLAGIKIPLEDVAEEVERKWPGQWPGTFDVGSRGPAFWVGAQNDSACIVTEDGLISFSQEKIFYNWTEILGPEFVRKYQADKIGGAIADVWYDGRQYYRKIEGAWRGIMKEDFVKWLNVRKGLDTSRGKHGVPSETTSAEVYVQERLIDGVLPRIYDPRDIIYSNGHKFLNCNRVHALAPAEIPQSWGENFPLIAEFFDTRFDSALVPCAVEGQPPQLGKDIFLAWTKRIYCSALAGDPAKGHAMFLVGGVNQGKTLLGTKIIGALLGGFGDASDHVSKGSEFNKMLIEVGLWTIDDGQVAADAASYRKFGEMIKRLVANPTMSYRAMYRDPQMAKWNGRIIVTLNDDIHSIQMLPDLETSMEEKIIILKLIRGKPFPPRHILEPTIASELPYLGRWLLDWEVPAEIVGDNRLGIHAYHHEEIRTRSLHSGGAGDLIELIDLWIRTCAPQEKYGEAWEGNATDFMSKLLPNESLRPFVQKFTTRTLGKRFSEASRIKDSGITVVASGKRGNRYRILLPPAEPGRVVRFTPETCVA